LLSTPFCRKGTLLPLESHSLETTKEL
jgi:hypothetical protein